MENEKILSNEELLNILGGSNFLSTNNKNLEDLLDSPITKITIPKEPVAVLLYAVKPIEEVKF